MSPLDMIIVALALSALSGILSLLTGKVPGAGEKVAALFTTVGALLGLTGSALGLFHHAEPLRNFYWPSAGNLAIGLDPLSAFFLIPVFLLGGLGPVYGLGYWKQHEHTKSAQRLHFFWGLLVAGLCLVLIGRNALVFLLGWEIMALAAFFLIAIEDDIKECRKSALVYLITSHLTILILFIFFLLWHQVTGSFAFSAIQAGTTNPFVLNSLFLLAVIAFGLKAGMMPFHFWLPAAHANAPSHVSAMLSGVLLKVGIYGLIRMVLLLPDPPLFWGWLILLSGAISGFFGVLFALAQHDLKRLLAYHSVENIGIILMGFGIALLGRSLNNPILTVLGMAGCLLHVWNHALFKSLLFYCAGYVVHRTGTRQIDKMGGLAKTMPWTAFFFLIGAVAISGIPPLNGFISEFLVYMGLLRPIQTGEITASGIAIIVPVLAMIGALASACFIKVYGAVFLGSARVPLVNKAENASVAMLVPMAIIALVCIVIGLFPAVVIPILASVTNYPNLSALVPFGLLSKLALVLAAGIAAIFIGLALRRKAIQRSVTWDCGYAQPSARIQYTASSFADNINGMFEWILKPHIHKPHTTAPFPGSDSFKSHVNEIVLDRALSPLFEQIRKIFLWFNRFQQGRVQGYIAYVLIAVLILLATLIPVGDWFALIFKMPIGQ